MTDTHPGETIRRNADNALAFNPFAKNTADAEAYDNCLVNIVETGNTHAAEFWPELTSIDAAIEHGRTTVENDH